MGNTLKMAFKSWSSSEFLPASGAGADISLKCLAPTVCRVLHGRIGGFRWNGGFEKAGEVLRGEFLRLEPATSLGMGNFNAFRRDTSTPGVGGIATSENVGGETFHGKGDVFIIGAFTKSRGGETTFALSRFDVLGDSRNGVEQGIAAGTLVNCWFGPVDLIVVLAGQTHSKSGGKKDRKQTCFQWSSSASTMREHSRQATFSEHSTVCPSNSPPPLKSILHFPQ